MKIFVDTAKFIGQNLKDKYGKQWINPNQDSEPKEEEPTSDDNLQQGIEQTKKGMAKTQQKYKIQLKKTTAEESFSSINDSIVNSNQEDPSSGTNEIEA